MSLISYFKNDINHGGAAAIIVGLASITTGRRASLGNLVVRKLINISCLHQSDILYDMYQQDVRITFVNGYSGHTLLKYDACFEGVLHITPKVKWVQFDSCVQTCSFN
jgi:hypothetical protein